MAPKFSIFPKQSVEAIEGYSVMIDCVVDGDPKPMIQWDKNSRMNDFDNSRLVDLDSTISPKSLQTFVMYFVKIKCIL